MAAPPDHPDPAGDGSSVTEDPRPCPECGHPIETDATAETASRTYTVCRSCYEVYVVNAGR